MMKIRNVYPWYDSKRTDDSIIGVEVVGASETYYITTEEIEKHLIESQKMCEECGDTGEVTTEERVYPREPHMAPTGTRKCHCKN